MAQQVLASAKTFLLHGLDFMGGIAPQGFSNASQSVYGAFPKHGDALHLIPCTEKAILPALDNPHHEQSWASLHQPDPSHWSWGPALEGVDDAAEDVFDGRGIYMCGYLDVPLDYTNTSDPRIVRLAITKYQVSGLARLDGSSKISTGQKSARTVVLNPGGPSASGQDMAWNAAESLTRTLSDSEYDILGWDPRGVNMSLPNVSCFPKDSVRDRWSVLAGTIPFAQLRIGWPRRAVAHSTIAQVRFADALNDATFHACKERLGDFPRFTSTAFVARDMDQIRAALGEDDLTAYLVSYGTTLGGTYVNMFPDKAGRVILDAVAPVRDSRKLGGLLYWPDDLSEQTWREGVLGECINAGPERCALAEPVDDGKLVTVDDLEKRMDNLFQSIADRPMPAYTDASGPVVVTYAQVVLIVVACLLDPQTWGFLAQVLTSLERGDASVAANMIDGLVWHENIPYVKSRPHQAPLHTDVRSFVVCSDSYDAPLPDGLEWWDRRWANMTGFSWLTGDSLFYDTLACHRFTKYWPNVAEVYRGDFNKKLKTPTLLMSTTLDPGVPLVYGKALLKEMGDSARLIVHHAYGHGSQVDPSQCSNAAAKAYMLHGQIPENPETDCYADGRPYLYGVS